MKRFILFILLSLFSLGGFAMTDGEWQEVSVAEMKIEPETFIPQLFRHKEYKNVDDLKDAMKTAKIWEVTYYSIGSVLVATGTIMTFDTLISMAFDLVSKSYYPEGATYIVCIRGALIGIASIPFFVLGNSKSRKYKRLKLQLEPMMSRDVMGTVNVSPGVGVSFNF